MTDIVLVDNSVYSFAFQLDNGIPIVSFYDDANDEEMLHLKFFLECLNDCDDVRVKNRDAFQLSQLAEAQVQKLKQMHNTPSSGCLDQSTNEKLEIQEVSPVDEGEYSMEK